MMNYLKRYCKHQIIRTYPIAPSLYVASPKCTSYLTCVWVCVLEWISHSFDVLAFVAYITPIFPIARADKTTVRNGQWPPSNITEPQHAIMQLQPFPHTTTLLPWPDCTHLICICALPPGRPEPTGTVSMVNHGYVPVAWPPVRRRTTGSSRPDWQRHEA